MWHIIILSNQSPSILQAGDTIKVTKQNENGMWEGELNGRKGWFPSKLVEMADRKTGYIEPGYIPVPSMQIVSWGLECMCVCMLGWIITFLSGCVTKHLIVVCLH